jgi:hypothetical protein
MALIIAITIKLTAIVTSGKDIKNVMKMLTLQEEYISSFVWKLHAGKLHS